MITRSRSSGWSAGRHAGVFYSACLSPEAGPAIKRRLTQAWAPRTIAMAERYAALYIQPTVAAISAQKRNAAAGDHGGRAPVPTHNHFMSDQCDCSRCDSQAFCFSGATPIHALHLSQKLLLSVGFLMLKFTSRRDCATAQQDAVTG